MSTSSIIQDPLGNTVMLSPELCEHTGSEVHTDDFMDSATTVVQQPALVLQLKDSGKQLYYFRSIAWNRTLLISTTKEDGHYHAYECTHNPTQEELALLFGKTDQVYVKGE
jgi:hypothetical protein